MGEMKAESAKQKDAEAKTFTKYAQWAKNEQGQLGFEIKTANAKIEKLSSAIASNDVRLEKLSVSIKHMDSEVVRMETEITESTALRTTQRDTFTAEQADLLYIYIYIYP